MHHQPISIRPFIGAKNYEQSRSFYRDLGFEEVVLSPDMSLFQTQGIVFYLQPPHAPHWVPTTTVFLQVDDVDRYWNELSALDLPAKYPGVRLVPVRVESWGKECFLTDPSGNLWHFGVFNK